MKSRETDMVYTQEVMHKMTASNTKKKGRKERKKREKIYENTYSIQKEWINNWYNLLITIQRLPWNMRVHVSRIRHTEV